MRIDPHATAAKIVLGCAFGAFMILWVVSLSGCGSIRGIEICKLDIQAGVGHCAEDSKQYDKKLPELDGYIALSEANGRKIADKLEACERESE